jgi:hypothetical protein
LETLPDAHLLTPGALWATLGLGSALLHLESSCLIINYSWGQEFSIDFENSHRVQTTKPAWCP